MTWLPGNRMELQNIFLRCAALRYDESAQGNRPSDTVLSEPDHKRAGEYSRETK